MEDKIQIEIPKADKKEILTISKGEFGDVKKKFEKIDQILFSITIVVVLSLAAIIISVIGLFLDQMRYNNVAYREYSQKTESVEMTQKINQELLEQNMKNQELIIELQKQILKK